MSPTDLPIIQSSEDGGDNFDPYGLEQSGPLPRGVTNPEIIDLIASDEESGEVVLSILEFRPWGASPDQLVQFDEKLNRYMSYILDGFLAGHFPQYKGRPVRLQIDCVDEPTGERERKFLEGVAMVCDQNDLHFVVRVDPDLATRENRNAE